MSFPEILPYNCTILFAHNYKSVILNSVKYRFRQGHHGSNFKVTVDSANSLRNRIYIFNFWQTQCYHCYRITYPSLILFSLIKMIDNNISYTYSVQRLRVHGRTHEEVIKQTTEYPSSVSDQPTSWEEKLVKVITLRC